jgi:hypothetical protein
MTGLRCLFWHVPQGVPLACTPCCDNNRDMDGFRFWSRASGRTTCASGPYCTAALYALDLVPFRCSQRYLNPLLTLLLQSTCVLWSAALVHDDSCAPCSCSIFMHAQCREGLGQPCMQAFRDPFRKASVTVICGQ